MNPIFIPRIKKALRSVELKTVKEASQEILKMRTSQDIEEYFIEKVLSRHPQAFLKIQTT